MATHAKFNLNSLGDLAVLQSELGTDVPVTGDLSILFEPVDIAGWKAGNRFVSLPMEGIDAEEHGGPGELTFRHYQRIAAGGSATIWMEACAADADGRSNPRQLRIERANLDHYKRLVEATRDAALEAGNPEPVLILQLTHSGRFSKPTGKPAPIFAQRNPELEAIQKLTSADQPVTDEALDRLIASFVEAAVLAEEAGFDGIDMKAVHGYLVAELLGSRMRENSRYGGSYENRTRFLRESLLQIKDRLSTAFITSRLTVYEPSAFPYGWGVEETEGSNAIDLTEPLRLLRELESYGLPLVGVSLGYPRTHPHWNRPFDLPLAGAAAPPEHPMEGVARFVDVLGDVQRNLTKTMVVSAGLSWLRGFAPNVGAAMIQQGQSSLLGLGRGLLAYPDLPRILADGGTLDPTKCCITCSKCSQIMQDVVCRSGCVIRDPGIYAKEYREGRKLAMAR